MPLPSGTHLGRYEILKPLGAGGMGEVYRARDTRLDREVAIKILHESFAQDPSRLARFEREAKAVAALSHPNILALHDAGTEQGTTYAVMELLEGETLRERLAGGAMPLRRAVDTAVQIARGLAAAHAKGLVHRDLKPENVFLVADGQVKILDFGLATSAETASGEAAATQTRMTDPGTVLGTVGYMAPEQVRGQMADARTDLFALGAVLYEMLTGARAFQRDTAAETMTAILREDPSDLPAAQTAQAPALDRIVRHCLEKNPTERFQSARDVAFALEALSGSTGTTAAKAIASVPDAPARVRSAASRLGLIAAAVVIVAGLAAWAAGYVHIGRAAADGASFANVTYQPVTFDEGFVFAARFARDGRTIVYSADWENQPRDIFVTSLDNSGARALGYKDADLLAVAPDGALAILVENTVPTGNPYVRRGTIARASLTGGAPRKELDRIAFADFAPDGSLMVARTGLQSGSGAQLEWPQGRVIVDQPGAFGSAIPNPRVSPTGEHVAFFVCEATGCGITIADKTGKTVAKSRPFSDWWGLAWAPGGREVWFSAVADSSGSQCTVYALDLQGHERLLFRTPGALTVHDVSAEGRILASFDQLNERIEMRASPTSPSRDLSWKEGGLLRAVSPDGVVLFGQTGNSGGPHGSVYVRRLADAEPVRLADGDPIAISDNGETALVVSHSLPLTLSLVPMSGLAQPLDIGPIEFVSAANWLKDGRLMLEFRHTTTEPLAVFARPAKGGPIAPLLPPDMLLTWSPVAPDGKHIAAADATGQVHVCTVPASGLATCAPVPGIAAGERIAGWSADSGSLFVYRLYPVPIKIDRVQIATGRRELMATMPTATAAVSGLRRLFVTPGGAVFYSYARDRSSLYTISGVK